MTRGGSFIVLAVLALVGAEALDPARAAACSCVQVSAELALREHAAVFEGRVRSVESRPEGLVVTLEVVQQWKGIDAEEAVVHTATSSAACGVAFEEETSWLVYADVRGTELQTGLCSRTRRIEEAGEDLAVLGAGVVPIEITADDEVEPPRGPAPSRGGCASCSAVAPSRSPALGGCLLPLVAWRLRRRVVTRR